MRFYDKEPSDVNTGVKYKKSANIDDIHHFQPIKLLKWKDMLFRKIPYQ
jgi:hypothetical protein